MVGGDPKIILGINSRMMVGLDPARTVLRQLDNGHTGFFWTKPDAPQALKDGLGAKAAKVPTRGMPDIAFRALAVASPQAKAVLPLLGRTQKFSTDKARTVLGFAPRPARDTAIDCGASLVG